jgi:Flp pilus assembly protein TadD
MVGRRWRDAVVARSRREWPGLGRLWIIPAAVALTMAAWYATAGWREVRLVDDGARLVTAGDYGAAARVLLRAIAVAPDGARAHYYLGLAYGRLGLPAGALSQLERAVRLAPGEARYHAGLGEAYREAGDAARARAELEEAGRRDAGNPRYQVDVAGVLLDEGETAQAVDHLRAAVQLQPQSPDLHVLLAAVLGQTGDRDGMAREYREIVRLAGVTPLGELARQELRVIGTQHPNTPGGTPP